MTRLTPIPDGVVWCQLQWFIQGLAPSKVDDGLLLLSKGQPHPKWMQGCVYYGSFSGMTKSHVHPKWMVG